MTPTMLQQAMVRLVRSLDTLSDQDHGAPSLLPRWSRAHVIAHLALNAEALAAALTGVVDGVPVAMYAGAQARDADIASLAPATPAALRARLLDGASRLDESLAALAEEHRDVVVERTPGSGRTFAAGEVAAMRRREVEIHHVDLDVGYRAADWPTSFAVLLVDQLAPRADATLRATDVGRTWQAEQDRPEVSGTAADLGWWLSGRNAGGRLTSDGGALPRIEAW